MDSSDWKSEIDAFLRQAGQGDEQAIIELIRKFEPEFRIIARRRIGPALRPYIDSMDIVQSVNQTLLTGLRDEKFSFDTTPQLMAFVTMLVRRKAARHWRRHRRQQRESGVALPDEHVGKTSLADLVLSLQHENKTMDDIEVREQLENVMEVLDETERQIISLRLEGCSTAEVARITNQNADVLRVRLSRLRKKLANSSLLSDLLEPQS